MLHVIVKVVHGRTEDQGAEQIAATLFICAIQEAKNADASRFQRIASRQTKADLRSIPSATRSENLDRLFPARCEYRTLPCFLDSCCKSAQRNIGILRQASYRTGAFEGLVRAPKRKPPKWQVRILSRSHPEIKQSPQNRRHLCGRRQQSQDVSDSYHALRAAINNTKE